MKSARQEEAERAASTFSTREEEKMEMVVQKEQVRRDKKAERRAELEDSLSYRIVEKIAIVMDKYCLDPIIGIIPGAGDFLTTIFSLPFFLYVSMFKVRSVALTLAIIANYLFDTLVGLLPYWVGNILDFFVKSNKWNFRLIKGYVEDDEETIRRVNSRAVWMGILIVVLIGLIVLMVWLLVAVIGKTIDFIGRLF